MQVEADGDAGAALAAVPGVRHVAVADQHARMTGFEIEAEANVDVRREVARAIVDRGWGLLELRPNRLSLEEIFLQLTTEEQRDQAPAALAAEPPVAEEVANG